MAMAMARLRSPAPRESRCAPSTCGGRMPGPRRSPGGGRGSPQIVICKPQQDCPCTQEREELESRLAACTTEERKGVVAELQAAHKHIYYHCSDYKPQVAAVTNHNMEVMLKEMIASGVPLTPPPHPPRPATHSALDLTCVL